MTHLAGISDVVRSAQAAIQDGRAAVIATVASSALPDINPASRLLTFADGKVEGSVDPSLDALLIRDARDALAERRSQLRSYTKADKSWERVKAQAGEVDVFFEVLAPAPHLVIVGAGHIALPLAQMASLLEFRVTVLDDRAEYATAERFPTANAILVGSYRDTLATVEIDADSFVVLVTRGHVHDQACLELMLERQPAYIGMIGSQRRVRTVMSHLKEKGYEPNSLQEVFAPVGLDIAAQTPAEIALSVLAEIVSVRRGGRSRSLRLGDRLRV